MGLGILAELVLNALPTTMELVSGSDSCRRILPSERRPRCSKSQSLDDSREASSLNPPPPTPPGRHFGISRMLG